MTQANQVVSNRKGQKLVQVIAFIDPAISHYDAIVRRIARGTEIAILDPQRDQFEQIAATLAARPEIKAVHVFSQNSPGHLYVSNTQFNLHPAHYSPKLSNWSPLLAVIDLFLHGCRFAGGKTGAIFLEKLHHLTSRKDTSSNENKGVPIQSWNLEVRIGDIEAIAL
ncbi:DUF4347 domain-containing protein [Kovacikia minuta CCNUW1]|uniref:DUF4347 domain-containing protein n=1 Tax=Kovacikia minuta TaxID=2931930 RepID=UPI001CCC8E40|nr:DUF4347 domain-containing protein [Kovacikia minuta]UBF24439.1 DUF4347 domain-containing protein [Kovacikia minuta CCNUW1]